MDFDQLMTFLEVAKLGSFSRAGQKVFRSQSAVSAQIRQLEQEYGDRLLDRSGKDVTLTPAGRVLLAYAERMTQMRDESKLAVADHGSAPRGRMVVGANEATCLYVLPDVFAKYCHLHPEVQLSIYRNFSYKIVEKLENGTIDVGIVTLPVKSAKLKTISIFRDQLMWMVNPQNPLAKQDECLDRRDCSRAHASCRRPVTPGVSWTSCCNPTKSELQVRMELPSVGMIKSFVAAGLGVSLISASFARDQVLAGRVKLIRAQGTRIVAGTGSGLSPRSHA